MGLSENDETYCLVKKEVEQFRVFWQKKPYQLHKLIAQAVIHTPNSTMPPTVANKSNKSLEHFMLIKPIPHEYIWRKTVFLPKTLNEIQLHQKVIQILKHEQPLELELLNIDYQKFTSNHQNLDRVIIYALRKSYVADLTFSSCILDCELHCYIRALHHFNKLQDEIFPHFSFKGKFIQFTEAEIQFSKKESENCIHLSDISISNNEIFSDKEKLLYLLALGATLWNGKASI